MEAPNTTPITTAGGKLLACALDDACSTLDCDAVMDDYADALLASAEGEEFVAHYCGVQYLRKTDSEEADEG
ncbi:MAG: hypothetical protein COW48_05740 [Hydrogenophilales bacterium CG17_big_fil_post_rev_8_21_14_2_50_63_12]|nr:MAG: hypothetical protein COW48_05740 [Hydrogenophilales bacterium CG17_big_fil_post_rev_8_21_14_2_50_63_12]PIX97497.1 MAG: hypothetical protein COZ24_05040 [Hydrogenophilales bacterium CG_4_10_14_3_um_filter_63_21]PJB02470.1 MAG: hypothetical protein CO126_11815 [Hydrogenophilales bacterium CG_4_9_14_3_um_filter_63_34]